jgi:GTP-binding protein Era
VIVDANRSLQPQARVTEEFLLNRLQDMNIPATLIFNKMDLINEDRDLLQEVVERYNKGYPNFRKTMYISAVYEEGLDKVKVNKEAMEDIENKSILINNEDSFV